MEAVEKMLVIGGSHGQLFVDANTGEILKRMYPCDCGECEGGVYAEIERFNINDTTRELTFDKHGVCYFDIVRIGYIENNEEYVPPVDSSPFLASYHEEGPSLEQCRDRSFKLGGWNKQ